MTTAQIIHTIFEGLAFLLLAACCITLNDIKDIVSDTANDIDLLRSAAEGIERNVNIIAKPINDRNGKRFARRLKLAWPSMVRELKAAFKKPRA